MVLLIIVPSLSAQTETPAVTPTPGAPATFAVPATSTVENESSEPSVTSTSTPRAPTSFIVPTAAQGSSGAGNAASDATAEADIEPTAQPTSSVTVFDVPPGRYEGQIDAATPAVRYRLSLQAGQIIMLTMDTTSGDLDPFLLLFDESETLLASNDDVETGNRSAQIAFTIPIEGTYLVEASRFNQDANAGRGTYLLTIDVAGEGNVVEPNDPLSVPPPFNVDYNLLNYDEFGTGLFDEVNQTYYFALGGQKGDFVRLTVKGTTGDLVPTAAILDSDLTIISRVAQQNERELVLYAALPETGWYLIEVGRESGRGDFFVFAGRAADSILELGTPIERTFTRDRNVFSFIFTATIGDRIFASATADAPDAQLEVTIFDLNQNALSSRQAQSDRVRIPSLVIPRSGPYIIQVRENGGAVRTTVSLDVRGIPVDLTKLNAIQAAYNERYTGTITNEKPVDYYRLVGKAGELVTLSMATSEGLDPYLILADANLNELAFNDNVGVSGNARITQFALPADGEYFILATRRELSRGETQGSYTLDITVGEITLQQGAFSVTLRWEGAADLNLFVRLPDGQIVSWSNPTVENGAQLQIDSNTGCTTPTAQPVEHIVRPGADLPAGDYTVWVWYQNVCGPRLPAPFSLEIRTRDTVLLTLTPQQNPLPPALQSPALMPDQRYEAVFRVGRENAVLVSAGSLSSPSPQQRASQGGDTAIFYGQRLTGTLNDEVFAQFYQFQGQEGETITIRAERLTGDLDPIIVLRDAADRNLAMNDDASSGTTNSELTFTLPATGRYTIAVTRFGLRDGTTRGDYRIVVERRSFAPVGEG